MTSQQMHRLMLGISTAALLAVLLLYLLLFGKDEELVKKYCWTAFAAIAAFAVLRLQNAGNSDTGKERVDSNNTELALLKVIFILPAAIGLILVAAVLFLQEPLRQVGWLLIVLGGYVGREVEFLLRTATKSGKE